MYLLVFFYVFSEYYAYHTWRLSTSMEFFSMIHSYGHTLENNANQSGRRFIGKSFVLQQDNDTKHTAIVCREYREKEVREG